MPPESKLPNIHTTELANGFRAYLVERRTLPIVASMVWYNVGSGDEHTGETGVSHFLEHMMFKGTKKFGKGQIDLLTAKMGGSNNAFTDHDCTAYHFQLASDRWETALEIEASRMRDCLLDPDEFLAEKNVVLEELAMGEDDPWHALIHATEGLVYQVHSYHHPIIGWKQDLERLSVETMRDFYQRHYGPERAFMVVVGDFDKKHVSKRIEELFGGLPSKTQPRAKCLDELPQRGARRAAIRAPGTVSRLAIAFRTCPMGVDDDFALDVLAHAMAQNRSSRLHRRLILEEGLASYVTAWNETRRDPGLFMILIELNEGADPGKVEAILRTEFAGLLEKGVPAAELKRIRTQLRASFLFEDETAMGLATKIGRFEAVAQGGHRLMRTYVERYDALDNKQLKEVAARYFSDDLATLVWSHPERAAVAQSTAKSKPIKAAAAKSATGKRGKKTAKKTKAGKSKLGKKSKRTATKGKKKVATKGSKRSSKARVTKAKQTGAKRAKTASAKSTANKKAKR